VRASEYTRVLDPVPDEYVIADAPPDIVGTKPVLTEKVTGSENTRLITLPAEGIVADVSVGGVVSAIWMIRLAAKRWKLCAEANRARAEKTGIARRRFRCVETMDDGETERGQASEVVS
jgi:hypothetical protein